MPPIDEMESRIAGAILADIPFLAKWRGVILSVGGGGGDPTSAPDPERLAPNLRTGRDLNLAMNALTTRRGLQPTELAHVMLEPLSPSIGTVIHGVDLANLSNEEVTLIKRVWLQRKMVAFRGQGHITASHQIAFAQRFGEVNGTVGEHEYEPGPLTGATAPVPVQLVDGLSQVLLLSASAKRPAAANGWHVDATWAEKPPMASVLISRECPPVGGNTIFADAYAMYEGLDSATKAKILGTEAHHQGLLTLHGTNFARHPVVRTHPETGAKALYVNKGFAQKLVGVDDVDGKLLTRLLAQVDVPEFQCRLQWEEGSVAFWDNRACQHYACGDFYPHTRRMERVTICEPLEENKRPFYRPDEAKAKL